MVEKHVDRLLWVFLAALIWATMAKERKERSDLAPDKTLRNRHGHYFPSPRSYRMDTWKNNLQHGQKTLKGLCPLIGSIKEFASSSFSNKNCTASLWQFNVAANKAVLPLELRRPRVAFASRSICITARYPLDAAACRGVSASSCPAQWAMHFDAQGW